MSSGASVQPRVCIDGKWITCLPAEEYGYVGTRYLCDLATTAGQPNRKLLIRAHEPPQLKSAGTVRPHGLGIQAVPGDGSLGLHSPIDKTYEFALPGAGGQYKKVVCQVLQQDVTNCLSLKRAVLRAAQEEKPKQVWKLFYSACKALRQYGDAIGTSRSVPLQCPSSLAIASDGRLFPLDAEVRLPDLSQATGLRDGLKWWFGKQGTQGFAAHDEASTLHARAVLLYFRQLLGSLKLATNPAAAPEMKQLWQQFEAIAAPNSLDDLLDTLEEKAEDWSIPADDTDAGGTQAAVAADPKRRPAASAVGAGPRSRSWLAALSGLLNVFLVAVVFLLLYFLLTGARGSGANALQGGADKEFSPLPPSDQSLPFASYCVVFPTQGTSDYKVSVALKALFPGQLLDLKGSGEEALTEKLEGLVKSLKNAEKLQALLVRLKEEKSVHFKGVDATLPDKGLRPVVKRGALYDVKGIKTEYGSLLQYNGPEKLLARAGLNKSSDEAALIEDLRRMSLEYASLKDALAMIGSRRAHLIHVAPTSEEHAKVRKALLGHEGTPVFVPRPIPEPFDAVDPDSGEGGGDAEYALRLERKCYWRQVGKDDRLNFRPDAPTNPKLRWASFGANEKIEWGPIGGVRKNRPASFSSFDVAVVLGNKVVVFRNQSIMVGASRDEIVKQARGYLTALKVRVPVEEAISIPPKRGKQFTGALLYSYLAEQMTREQVGEDIQIVELPAFQTLMATEGSAIDGAGKKKG